MQLPFFYEEKLPEGTEDFDLSPETSKHLSQVLRMKEGESLILTNGRGIEMNVTIAESNKKKTKVSFLNKRNLLSRDNLNGIAISLLKNENRFEWFLEKATELGIGKIYPVITSRTEKKSMKAERTKNIMVSAMLQSRQYFMPELSDPIPLTKLLDVNDFQQKMIAHCVTDDEKAEIRHISDAEASKLVLIGPEGDFTAHEIDMCVEAGFLPVSLGNTRLRTETAGIVAAVHLMSL